MLTVPEAVRRARCNRETVRRWIRLLKPPRATRGVLREASLSEAIFSVVGDTSVLGTRPDRAGQLLVAGSVQHHDHGMAHDARVLTRVVRLLHLGGEPQLRDTAAQQRTRD